MIPNLTKELGATRVLALFLIGTALATISSVTMGQNQEVNLVPATGIFEVELTPQKDADAPAGRMIVNKKYSGDMQGTGIGQMISKRTESGTAVYSAIEEFEGSLAGKSGSFTLLHRGLMNTQTQSLEIDIVEGSGTDELKNISGSMSIQQEDGVHRYELNYTLDAHEH